MGQFFDQTKLPYICTPLTGKTTTQLLEQLDNILEKEPDMIEWRADFFEHLHNEADVFSIIKAIKEKSTIPLLFTIRSIHEGGETISLTEAEKVSLLCNVCKETNVDLIDYETSNDPKDVELVVKTAKKHDKQIVLSFHHFEHTPSEDELIERAKNAAKFHADIIKLAVMPEEKEDVFRLLEVTRILNDMFEQPIITMSMGELGTLSRINGWLYGSVLTFAVGIEQSAPGQIAIEPLREAIWNTKQLMPNW